MNFDLQPTLFGERVCLRPLRASDYEALYRVASDPLIWEQHPERNRHEEPIFRRFFAEAMASGGALLALDRATQAAIGSSRYCALETETVEIGWTFLARSHWGGVYNGEIKRLMLEHAFRFFRRVVFLVGPDNLRSRRALETVGAVLAGTRLNAAGRESLMYAIDRVGFGRVRRAQVERVQGKEIKL